MFTWDDLGCTSIAGYSASYVSFIFGLFCIFFFIPCLFNLLFVFNYSFCVDPTLRRLMGIQIENKCKNKTILTSLNNKTELLYFAVAPLPFKKGYFMHIIKNLISSYNIKQCWYYTDLKLIAQKFPNHTKICLNACYFDHPNLQITN